jgi:bacillithiol biosynthesis cysteine-adding enzyme BshC
MISRHIDFKDVPGYSKLFLDFLHEFSSVAPFYSSCSVKVDNLARCVQQILRRQYPRALVADVLQRQNVGFGAAEATLRNVERLKEANTVAVVTGQQVGLFTGPLLALYKALTAIKVSQHLNGLSITAVPVFWMPSEDHDFAEISKTYFIDAEGALSAVEYELEASERGKSVGQVVITTQIEKLTERLRQLLPRTEFSMALLDEIVACYRPGNTFSGAFAELMLKLLGKYGLILLDPMDPDLKRHLLPMFEKALCMARPVDEAIGRRNDELTARGYELQVNTTKSSTLLFYLNDGKRTPVRMQEDDRFSIADQKFSCAALVDLLKKAPEKFSPNVLLRPLTQDVLLPTAAYVGGPAEIAYYAQLQPLYRLFGEVGPIIIPRASFTLLEKKIEKLLDKYQLQVVELFDDLSVVFKKAVERVLASDTAHLFDQAEVALQEKLTQLEKTVTDIDPSLISAINHARDKIAYQIRHLETKFVNVSAKRYETAKSQIEKAGLNIYPNKMLQERVLNPYHFLARYGRHLIDTVYEAIDLNRNDHTILIL